MQAAEIGIIFSGAYLEPELTSELGFIPPSFIGLGGEFLIEYQFKLLNCQKVFLILPDDFHLNFSQLELLKKKSINVIKISRHKKFEDVYNEIIPLFHMQSKRIILGDSLFINVEPLNNNTSFYSVHNTSEYYNWKSINSDLVFSGFIQIEKQQDDLKFKDIFDSTLFEEKNYGEWLDFGHVHTFFKSKINFTSTRHFNSVKINNYTTTKSSADHKKMLSEYNWFLKCPIKLKRYIPGVISSCKTSKLTSYEIETILGHTLNDLFVYYNLNNKQWRMILGEVNQYLFDLKSLCSLSTDKNLFDSYFYEKTFKRLCSMTDKYPVSDLNSFTINNYNSVSIYKVLNEIEDHYQLKQVNNSFLSGYIHGDFCFSNMIFDFRSSKLKVYDPKGWDNVNKSQGPFLYEVAKFCHSCLMNYDNVINDEYNVTKLSQNTYKVDCYFSDKCELKELIKSEVLYVHDLKLDDIYYAMFHLFLSMIPLHSDKPDRQIVFLLLSLNCNELYYENCVD